MTPYGTIQCVLSFSSLQLSQTRSYLDRKTFYIQRVLIYHPRLHGFETVLVCLPVKYAYIPVGWRLLLQLNYVGIVIVHVHLAQKIYSLHYSFH